MKRIVVGSVLSAMVFGTWCMGKTTPLFAAEGAAPNTVTATVTGESYCLLRALLPEGSALKGEETQQALKVTSAKDTNGNALPELSGWTLHYLRETAGKELAEKEEYRNKLITLQGTVFRQERVVQVTKIVYASEAAPTYERSGRGSMSGQLGRTAEDYNYSDGGSISGQKPR